LYAGLKMCLVSIFNLIACVSYGNELPTPVCLQVTGVADLAYGFSPYHA